VAETRHEVPGQPTPTEPDGPAPRAGTWVLPRIRQAVLVAADLEPLVTRLRAHLGRWVRIPEPYRDPGVAEFGVENAVLAVGDSFLEVLAPVRPDTAVGRHLARRGGGAGYMVMLQVTDMAATRRRVSALDVRVVWQVALPDATDLHLHPRDVPGALVAVDTMDPPGSWRWGGPAFTGRVAEPVAGGLVSLRVAVPDPRAAARRWAAVAGVAPAPGTMITLAGGRQLIEFVPETGAQAGLVGIGFALPGVRSRPDDLKAGATSIETYPLAPGTPQEETLYA
jgi:hypothetical protein